MKILVRFNLRYNESEKRNFSVALFRPSFDCKFVKICYARDCTDRPGGVTFHFRD